MAQATAIEDAMENLAGFNSLLGQTKKDSAVVAQQWDLTNKLLSGLATYASGWLFLQTKIGQELKGAKRHLQEIAESPFDKSLGGMEKDLAFLREEAEAFYDEQQRAGTENSAMAKEQMEQYKRQDEYLTLILKHEAARNEAVKKYDQFHRQINWQLGAYVILLAKASHLWYTINQVLGEARAAEGGRSKLFNESLQAAMKLGASTSETMTVMSALIERGRDLTGNFQKDVNLALQLHKAYGLSTYDAAELVASFGALKVDTQRVADGIARVAAETALSANEATRLASSIARTFALMRPGQASGLGEVSKFILEVEGRLESLTGTSGDLVSFYKRAATTIEGMSLAEQLGIDPSTLGKNKAAAEQFTVGLANMVENLTRGLDDRGRVLVLQQLAQQLGTDATMLANLTSALKTNNKQASEELTLRKQFDDQMRNTGQSLRQLYQAGQLLLGQVMVPIIRAITPVVDWFTKFIQSLLTFKPVLVLLQGLAIAALPYVVIKLTQASVAAWALGKALVNLTRTAAQAAIATQAQAAANRRASMAQGEFWPDMGTGRRTPSRIPGARRWGGRFGRLSRLAVVGRRVRTAQGAGATLRALLGIKEAILGGRSIMTILSVGSRALLAFLKPALTYALLALKGIAAAVGIAGGIMLTVGAGLAVALHLGFKSLHKAQDQEIKAQLNLYKQQDNWQAQIRRQLGEAAKRGDVKEMKSIAARARELSRDPETKRLTEQAIGMAWQEIEGAINQRFLQDVREQHGVAKTEDELKYYDQMLAVSEELRLTAMEQLKEMRRQAKEEEQKKKDDEKNADRERLLKLQDAMGKASKGRWR